MFILRVLEGYAVRQEISGETKINKTSRIHSARQTVPPVAITFPIENCFV